MGPHLVVRRRSDAVAAGLGLATLVGCALIASSGTVGALERSVFESINGLPDTLEPVMHAAQFLGVLAVGPAVALVALGFRRRRLALAALMVTVLKLAAERTVWRFVDRQRPGVTEPEVIVRGVPTAGVSFVSGHVVLVSGLAWVISPYLRGGWRIAPWAVVALVSFARIYLGAHNPLDVLGGLGLGIAIGAVTNLVVGVPAAGHAAQADEPGRGAPGPTVD